MRVSAGSGSVVRDLFNRTLGTRAIAVFTVALPGVALFGAALLGMAFVGAGLMPQPAWAAGLMVGHAGFNAGSFQGFSGPALVRPRQAPQVIMSRGPAAVLVNRRFGFEPTHERRRFFGFGFPIAGFGPAFGPFEAPVADTGVVVPGAALRAVEPGGAEHVSAIGGDCRSETRTVPSEAGGERPIKITWCR
jgi:hypothetical protein